MSIATSNGSFTIDNRLPTHKPGAWPRSCLVGGDDKPAGFGVPSRLLDRRSKDGALGRTLDCKDQALLRRGEVLGKTFPYALFCQHQIAVIDLSKLAVGWGSRIFRRHSAERLAFFRSEGGDVNHARHFGIVSCLRDDCAAVGMADQEYRPNLRVDQAIGGGNVVGNGA